MKYDFDKVIDRSKNHSTKYSEMKKIFGSADLIPLWIADMDFKTAQPIIDAMKNKAEQGIFGYVYRPDSFFESVAIWQKERHGWSFDPSQISHAIGVVPAYSSLILNLTEIGDKVLIQTPVYTQFFSGVKNFDRELVENRLINKDGYYTIDWLDFEEKLASGVKLFLFSNPQNPVGRVWTRDELLKMANLCLKYRVRVISDEIHSDLLLWGNKHIPMAALSDEIAKNTITCISASKTFNLAGLHSSSIVFYNKEEQEKYNKYWQNFDIARNNAFSIVAMEAAYREGGEWLDQLLSYLEGNAKYICDFIEKYLPQIKVKLPEATYLLWLDCRELGFAEETSKFFIEKAKLALTDGENFGADPGFMRLNIACPRVILEQAMKNLKEAVDKSYKS